MDSGATDHMTHSSKYFLMYTPYPINRKIATADGSLTIVAGVGDVQINPIVTLKKCFSRPQTIHQPSLHPKTYPRLILQYGLLQ
jgi:hypothetical protein